MKQLISVILVSSLAACTSLSDTPTFEQLDWKPKKISVENCPDLSGQYISPDAYDYEYIFPNRKIGKGIFNGDPNIRQRDQFLEIIITIQSRPDGVLIHANNGRNHVETFTPYDGIKFGCHDGMLVSRFIGGRIGGAESGKCVGISYGEYQTYLNSDSDALVVRNARERCGTFGALAHLPPSKEIVALPVVFRRVR